VDERLDIGGRVLVVFDGRCAFCNRAVRWLLRRDRRDRLRFVASESVKVAEVLGRHGVIAAGDGDGPGTLLVVRDTGGAAEKVLVRSDAAVAALRELPGAWPVVGMGLRLIPRVVRDFGYGLVARWRYRIWGRLESCPIPTAGERERFL
jgi:predicted DCC family thiol-disulfide oxidoreductase YuxK